LQTICPALLAGFLFFFYFLSHSTQSKTYPPVLVKCFLSVLLILPLLLTPPFLSFRDPRPFRMLGFPFLFKDSKESIFPPQRVDDFAGLALALCPLFEEVSPLCFGVLVLYILCSFMSYAFLSNGTSVIYLPSLVLSLPFFHLSRRIFSLRHFVSDKPTETLLPRLFFRIYRLLFVWNFF